MGIARVTWASYCPSHSVWHTVLFARRSAILAPISAGRRKCQIAANLALRCPIPDRPIRDISSYENRSGATASSAESWIRKAVGDRGLTPGPVGLADPTAEDEAATGTALALL